LWLQGVKSSAMTKYWLALNSVKGVGSKTLQILISRFGSPAEVLSAPVIEIARVLKLDIETATEIASVGEKLSGFEKFIAQVSESGIEILCPDDREYPHLLKITDDFPPILYRKGNGLPEDEITVAVVGTRSPSPNGIRFAGEIAKALVEEGIAVVSGLAIGIDTAAHKGALKSGGKTLAVIGSGLKTIYPQRNRQLADDICINGAVLSECHLNEVVSGRRLMQRNRITSGLSHGVILIEPGKGAWNTAERALKQGRSVFIYNNGDKTSAELFPEGVLPIKGASELNFVLDRLSLKENAGDQMYLFPKGGVI